MEKKKEIVYLFTNTCETRVSPRFTNTSNNYIENVILEKKL